MSELPLSQYLDFLPLGLLFFNNNGELIWLNQKAYRILEISKSVEFDKVSKDGKYGEVHKVVQSMIQSESDLIVSDPESIETRFGKFNATIYPMYVPHDSSSLWVCCLQQANTKSDYLNTEHLHEFIHGVSAPISNLTAWLKALLEGNDQQKHFLLEPDRLQILYYRAETAVKMLNDYLFNESLQITHEDKRAHSIDLHVMLHELLESFEWKAREKSLVIEEKFCKGQVIIKANPLYIETLFTILIDNAIKYNRVNGRLVLSTQYNDDQIEVHVIDTGIGIPEKEIELVFNDFYRSDAVKNQRLPGSGLGLSIAQKIVKMYDSELIVQSQEGKGSEFIVQFPRF